MPEFFDKIETGEFTLKKPPFMGGFRSLIGQLPSLTLPGIWIAPDMAHALACAILMPEHRTNGGAGTAFIWAHAGGPQERHPSKRAHTDTKQDMLHWEQKPLFPSCVNLYMGKTGTIWQLFRALFPSTWRPLSPDALFTRIQDTRKHPEFATFSCFPCQYTGALSPEMPFFMVNAKLPNRPCFALLLCKPPL